MTKDAEIRAGIQTILEDLQPVYPIKIEANDRAVVCTGISKREWFAGLALQGLLASKTGDSYSEHLTADYVATKAVESADALIAALSLKKAKK